MKKPTLIELLGVDCQTLAQMVKLDVVEYHINVINILKRRISVLVSEMKHTGYTADEFSLLSYLQSAVTHYEKNLECIKKCIG